MHINSTFNKISYINKCIFIVMLSMRPKLITFGLLYIYRRLRIGRDGHLDQFEAYNIS